MKRLYLPPFSRHFLADLRQWWRLQKTVRRRA